MLKKILSIIVVFVIGIGLYFSLSDLNKNQETSSEVLFEEGFEDWTEETHSNDAEADYEKVFPQEKVNRMDLVISEENWEIMMDDMESLYGSSGENNMQSEKMPQEENREMPREEENGEMPMEMAMGKSDSDGNPVFVESQVFFNNVQWYNVGLRFKGNSSLRSVWQSGNSKLPFKLDFDQFEEDYPELKNQRFYGFKQLSLSSSYQDSSLMHEKLATEAFDAAGVAGPETAFYELYIDYGEGATYFGLYTAVEVIDDTVIDSDFNDNDGNLYKAEGNASSFSTAQASNLKKGFDKKSNESEDDWSDLEKLSSLINSDLRISDYETWKSDLEEIFDTDAFLNWLAVNTVIQNWDTYGNMTHNYYLYNNPDTQKLTWIPWDNNESFSNGKKSSLSLTFNEVSEDWPLINYLMEDENYRETYLTYVKEFLEDTFDTVEFKERVSDLHDLIEPFVVGENGEQEGYTFLKNETEFTNSITVLLNYIEERIELASAISLDSDWEYNATLSQSNQQGRPGERMSGEPLEDMRPPR